MDLETFVSTMACINQAALDILSNNKDGLEKNFNSIF